MGMDSILWNSRLKKKKRNVTLQRNKSRGLFFKNIRSRKERLVILECKVLSQRKRGRSGKECLSLLSSFLLLATLGGGGGGVGGLDGGSFGDSRGDEERHPRLLIDDDLPSWLPFERLLTVHRPRGKRQQTGKDETGRQDVHRLGELLAHIAPQESDTGEDHDDDLKDLFGFALAGVVHVRRPWNLNLRQRETHHFGYNLKLSTDCLYRFNLIKQTK